MIVSTSTIRFLALATLAVSARATNSIRGNTKQAQDLESSPQNRDLMEIDMNVGLNKMDCKEDSDGSIVCIFRMMPLSELDKENVMYECFGTSKNNLCLKSEVTEVMYNQVPESALVTATPPQNPQPQPVVVNPSIVGSVGTCPAQQQNTGLGCSQYIPSGATETLCVYGQTRCECKLENNNPSIAVGWKCSVSQQKPVTTLPAQNPPKPPASNNESYSAFQCRPFGSGCSTSHPIVSTCLGTPACCPNNIIEDWTTNANTCKHGSNNNLLQPPTNGSITANINAVAATPPKPTTTYQQGYFVPKFTNSDLCPPEENKPVDGTACSINFNIGCTYGYPAGYKDCACGKSSGTWECRPSRIVALSF